MSLVILKAGKREEEFEFDHAERLLRMPNNGGWELPKDSKYEWDSVNGLKLRTDKRTSKKPEEESDNK